METSKLKKRMSSESCLTSKLYDKIIKMLSKSQETIPLKQLLVKTSQAREEIMRIDLTVFRFVILIERF
jgi:hypothetical protein